MAELAIPLIALGGMYVISNTNKEQQPKSYNNIPTNYPITKPIEKSNVNLYPSSNQATDKYYKQNVYERIESNKPNNEIGSVGGGNEQMRGLTGEIIDKNNFKHNNMVPFFGAKIRGATNNRNTSEHMLDHMQGSGSQHFHKKEVAPLFQPHDNLTNQHGMPNVNDFMMSRVNPSQRMANIKPWDEVQVGPGLNKGYTAENSNAGFNSGMEARETWLPKTVDELRVDTNPKLTYDLDGHQGPANSHIKESGTIQTQGRVEKNRPDTDYYVGPNRWFTTTGLEKGQTARSINILKEESRIDTTRDYYGTQADKSAPYVKGEYNEPHRQTLDGPGIIAPNASGRYSATTNDHGNGSYIALPNHRSTTKQPEKVGGIHGILKATIAPLLDVLRPSKKQHTIDNIRKVGHIESSVKNGPVWNPADRTKTTIREQTEGRIEGKYQNIQNHSGSDAYIVTEHQPVDVQRDTTNREYSGIAGPSLQTAPQDYTSGYAQRNKTMEHPEYSGTAGPSTQKGPQSYDSAYRQRNNVNKSYPNRPNQGGTQMFNNYQNLSVIRDDSVLDNNRYNAPSARISHTPNVETYGTQYQPNILADEQKNMDRIDPDLLNAFKQNPYTQSLQSWA